MSVAHAGAPSQPTAGENPGAQRLPRFGGDVLAPRVLMHVQDDVQIMVSRPGHGFADALHVALVERTGRRLQGGPVDEQPDDAHPETRDLAEVVLTERQHRAMRRVGLVVVAELVDVDAAQQDGAARVVRDPGCGPGLGVQRPQCCPRGGRGGEGREGEHRQHRPTNAGSPRPSGRPRHASTTA